MYDRKALYALSSICCAKNEVKVNQICSVSMSRKSCDVLLHIFWFYSQFYSKLSQICIYRLLYLAECLQLHLSALYKWLQVDVCLWGDGAPFSCLPDHSQTFVKAAFVVELPQVGLAIHLDAVLHVGVTAHQALHVANIKLFQLRKKGWTRVCLKIKCAITVLLLLVDPHAVSRGH